MNHAADAPTILDLFSGIGGLSLAFHAAGFRTTGFVEFDPTKRIVLESHFAGPFFGDIDQFDCGEFLRAHGRPDVIAGGVPCQAISLLGTRLGTSDPRWKWPQAIRLVRELRPRFAVFENPPAILTAESGRAFNGIISQMAALGYDGWWDVIPAAAFGAGHWRERLCIVFADALGVGKRITPNEADTITGGGDARPISSSEDHQRILSAHANGGEDRKRPDGFRCDRPAGAGEQIRASHRAEVQPGTFSSHAHRHSQQGEHRELSTTEGRSKFDPAEQNNRDGSQDSLPAHANDARLQGHAGNGGRSPIWSSPRRPDATPGLPDLRGRVTGPNWWFEVVAGIPCLPAQKPDDTRVPVLATGLPGKLVEAASKCIGDSVVPQAWLPIAQALYQKLRG